MVMFAWPKMTKPGKPGKAISSMAWKSPSYSSIIFPSTTVFKGDYPASHVWLHLRGFISWWIRFFASLKLSWHVTKAGLRLRWRERCIPRAAGRNDWEKASTSQGMFHDVLLNSYVVWMSCLCYSLGHGAKFPKEQGARSFSHFFFESSSAWWFGTIEFLWLSIQLGMSGSQLTKSIIFQGVGWSHQPVIVFFEVSLGFTRDRWCLQTGSSVTLMTAPWHVQVRWVWAKLHKVMIGVW